MKKMLILLLLIPFLAQSQQLSFPEAEGFGRFTTGGRGGEVYIVTTLADSAVKPPSGSLRWALNKTGPRTIVFAVSGTIELKGKLNLTKGDVTIAGQTAPGDGICLKDHPFIIDADNVIIRYMRFRCGNYITSEVAPDAVSGTHHKNIIIDHCSMSWSVDETGSFYDNENFTLQWCLLSESLYAAGHPKGDHGYGGIWGGMGASFHHNLLASHTSRNPRFCGARYHPGTKDTELVDFRNNVIFNWGFNSAYGGEMGKQNMINNYFKSGPATKPKVLNRIVETWDSLGRWYIDGNYVKGFPDITSNNWAGGVQGKSADDPEIRVSEPFAFAPVVTQSAEEAYKLVLENAGTIFPVRDALDKRIISETKSGKCAYGASYGAHTGIIDSPKNTEGWPVLKTYNVRPDNDNDGMPDAWEKSMGLDGADPADRNKISPDGYTMLEKYINGLPVLKK
jgi:pectate lyase